MHVNGEHLSNVLAAKYLAVTFAVQICAGKLRKRMMPLRELDEFVE